MKKNQQTKTQQKKKRNNNRRQKIMKIKVQTDEIKSKCMLEYKKASIWFFEKINKIAKTQPKA